MSPSLPQRTLMLLAAAATPWTLAHAAEPSEGVEGAEGGKVPRIVVTGIRADTARAAPATTDTAAWLGQTAGLSTYAAGGVSALPVLRGLADDRIKIRIDGAEPTAACGNHMNPPLSYLSPQQVGRASVIAGITPVSQGGDSIAGTIEVNSPAPAFAPVGGRQLLAGEASLHGGTIDNSVSSHLGATLANDWLSLNYAATQAEADSYRDGHGHRVADTLYKSLNQLLTLGLRPGEGQQWVLKLGQQHIPYQGFATQYMDMTDNTAHSANLGYEGQFGWGRLEGTVYWQNTFHTMGFFSPERTGMMPMDTHGRDTGYRLQAEWPVAEGTLRVGQAYHRFRLDDWWPPVAGSKMMGPGTYWNIRDGRRDRWAGYGEWEGPVAPAWTLQGGLRYEAVRSDTGEVQDYGCGMMCAADHAAASAFNAADRARRDHNIDVTLLARHAASATLHYEIGLARKSRSPNLYERYAWGRSTMAMSMIGWYGDGNGYVGNLNLKPEVANTLSAAIEWQAPGQRAAGLRIEPYYTYVQDFIDADPLGRFNPYGNTAVQRRLLGFANHDAQLYGLKLTGQAPVWSSTEAGEGLLSARLDWTRGQRRDGGSLYQIMPPNLMLALEQRLGGWTHRLQWTGVAAKRRVDETRGEPSTPAYALLDLSTRYEWAPGTTAQLAVRNLFDRAYPQPLGGVNVAALKGGATDIAPLAGQGRSLALGLDFRF